MMHRFRSSAILSVLFILFPLFAAAQTPVALPYTMTTLAGTSPMTATSGTQCPNLPSNMKSADAFGDGCLAVNAVFGAAARGGVEVDSYGNVFISDDINKVVHVINPTTGIMTVAAGLGSITGCTGAVDKIGDGCLAATQTVLNGSRGIGIDPYGNVLLAGYSDEAIHIICRVASPLCVSATPSPSSTNPIQVEIGDMGLVGGCATGSSNTPTGGSGLDNTPGFSTKTNTLAAFTNGGTCSTSLGEITQPRGVTGDIYGNVYYADTNTARWRVVLGPQTYNSATNPLWAILQKSPSWTTVTAGYVYTVGGLTATATVKGNSCNGPGTALDTRGDGCLFTSASVNSSTSDAQGVVVDAVGNMIFTDAGNGLLRVLFVSGSGTAGAAMVNAIEVNNPTMNPSTPQTGFIYALAGEASVGTTAGISATPNLGNSRTALDTSTFKVAVSPQGNIYIGDSTRVLFFDIKTGYIRILFTQASNVAAGNSCTAPAGQKSLSAYSDGCAATSSAFGNSNGLGISADGQGNLYLFDSTSNGSGMLVRKVLAQGLAQQTLRTALIQNFQTHLLGATSSTSTVTHSTNADYSYGTPSCTLNGDGSVDCTTTVTATPSAAGLRSATMTVANASSGESLSIALGGTVSGSVLAFDNASTTTNSVTTPIAPTTNAIFSSITPASVAADGAGNVYASSGASLLESIGGTTYTLSSSLPSTPSQIAVDPLGDVFVVDNLTSTIQELAVSAAGTPATYTLTSIPYACTNCTTAAPQAIAADQAGNLFVADYQSGGSSIYRLSLVGTAVQQQMTVATGLINPVSLAVDPYGNVYVADKGAGKIYELTPAIVNGLYAYAQSTRLSNVTPVAVAVDAAGNVYVQDDLTRTAIEIPVNGPVTTVLIGLQNPTGLAVDGLGNVYLADSGKTSITEVVRDGGSYGSTSSNVTSIAGTLTNVGNLAATGITQTGNSTDFNLAGTGCTIGSSNSIAAGLACPVSATLSAAALQSSPGTSFTETLSFLAAPTTIGSVTFSDAVPAGPTAMTITGPSSALFAASGTEATFTVTVAGITAPSGSPISVTVTMNSTVVYTSTPSLNSSGQALVSLSGLSAGGYIISASYAGVPNTYSPSSAQAAFTINQFVATGDTRTVTEPAFPSVCATLSAALTSVNDDLPTSVDAVVTNPDGARIQAALNSCASTGQAVELSVDGAGHNAYLTGPLSMPSGVSLLVDPGVFVYFSRNVQDYDKVPGTHTCGTVNSSSATSSCKPLIDIPGASTNVGIMGYGKLDGRGGDVLINAISPYQGQSWWGLSSIANGGGNQQNPRFIQIDSGASNITMYKITLRNSPLFHVSTTGAASNFTAWDIKIVTPTSSRNTDGIDPGNATNFTITRSWVSDGDDNIAVGGAGTTAPAANISVTNNHFFAGHGESIGSYTSAGVSNVLFDSNMSSGNGTAGKGSSVNNTADSNSTGLRIKSGYDRGGVVTNVQYSNSCYQYHKAEIVFSPNYENTTGSSSPNFKNILIQNNTFLTEGTAQFTGTNNSGNIFPLQVTLDNVGFNTLQTSDFSIAPTNAQLSYGPGVVSSNFINSYATFVGLNGNTVTSNITESTLLPPTCNFTYIAPELTGPAGVPQTITAGQNATAVVILTPAVAGSAYPTGTVTLTDALTSNAVTVTLTGTTDTISIPLTGLSAGTHTFTATYSGDANYVPSVQGSPYTSAGPYLITVNAGSLGATTTTLSGVPSTAAYGTSFTATATVSGSSPTGTVEFIVNGSAYATEALSSGAASASISLPFSASAYSIYAVYSGDASNAGSTSSISLVTITAALTSTALSASATTAALGHPVLLTATVSSVVGTPVGGTVSFTYTTPSNSTPVVIGLAATLIGGSAFASADLPPGTNYVTATYSGSTDFAGSASTATTLTVSSPAIISLPSNPIALAYTISTIAGGAAATNANTTCAGSTDSFGDGCQGTAMVFTSGNDMRGVAADPFGNVYVTDKSAKLVRRISPNGVISNFAGRVSGTACVPTATVGCTPTLVSLSGSRGVSSDAQGNIYMADYNGNNVYKVSVSTGLMYLVAGIGTAGATVNGSPATSTSVNTPRGVWADAIGNIYIADTGGNQVLVVDTAGYIHIFAGTGTTASNGDGGPALSAAIDNPQGVVTDVNLNVYIADSSGGRIRVVCVTCGTGSPLDALLATLGVATPVNGNIYTVAGSGSTGAYGGTLPTLATNVSMTAEKLAFDNSGNLYISDSNSNAIWFEDFRTGYIRAIAKSGTVCGSATDSVGDGCPATQAIFGSGGGNGLGVATDTLGNVYISDTTNLLIRKVSTGLASASTATGSTTTQPVLLHFIAGDGLASLAYQTTEWSLGTPNCTTNADTTTDCLLASGFTPAVPGARSTPLAVNSSLSNKANLALTGIGLGAGSTLDPASQISFGTNLQVAGLAADATGNIYVSDARGKKLLRFAPAALGQGTSAASTSLATLTAPGAVAVDPRGYAYVADTSTGLITQVSPAGAVSTLPLTLTTPSGLAVDALNNLYVSDSSTATVYQVNPITGAYRTLAAGTLVAPAGLAIDPNGNLLIADPGAAAIYRLNMQSGVRTTVSTSAVRPSAVVTDAAGNLLIADTAAILALPASSNSSSFKVASLAPLALAIDSAGNLYTGAGGAVLKLTRTQGYVQFAGASPLPQTVNLLDSGNQALSITSINQTDTADYGLAAAASTDCTLNGALPSGVAAGGVCALTATYTPTTFVTTTDTATFNGNLSNAPVQLKLTGPGAPPTATISLSPFSPASPVYGQAVTVTANVSGPSLLPVGSVVFTVDSSTSSASLNSGVATVSLTGLTAGPHTVSAVYTSSNGFTSAGVSSILNIASASLTVTAAGVTRPVGAANSLSYTITGFVNGDTSTVVSGAPSLTTTASASSPAGVYPVTVTIGTLAAVNYTFTFQNGTLTVGPVAAAISLSGVTPGNTAPLGQAFALTYLVQGVAGGPVPTGSLAYTVDGGAKQTTPLTNATATNATATVTLTGLAAGSHSVQANYSGDSNYQAAAAAPVTLTVTTAPVINPGGLVGAAGSGSGSAAGGLTSIFGTNLAPSTAFASAIPLPTTLGGVQVLVNGVAAPLLYVSPTQINFQLPYQTPTGTPVQIVVVSNGVTGPSITVTFGAAAPAIFTYQRTPTSTDPVILHADNTLVTPSSPAKAGEILVIYATGAGPLNNAPASGAAAPLSPLATTVATPVVTVGGSGSTVQFSGLAPNFVGLLQINIQLPATLPAGTGTPPTLPLVVTFPGAPSASVNLWVSQ